MDKAQLALNLSCMFVYGFINIFLLIALNKHQILDSYEVAPEDFIQIDAYENSILDQTGYATEARNRAMRYILIWVNTSPFHLTENGQDIFVVNRCKHSNCYLTTDSKYLKDPSDFDAILFSGIALRDTLGTPFKIRSLKQKYVFAMLEAAPIFPVTHPVYDEFFNWTWTYRLESDVTWRYITIYDLNGNVVGPAVNMNWARNWKPIDEKLKRKLNRKTKAVAWFVSHCGTQSRREEFFEKFIAEFRKYGLSVDVYGECGQYECTRSIWCFRMLEKYYHFYLSFENALEEDYVTEKVLNALDNLVVPVVFGGANYSRFLPPESYLNARELGPKNLAKAINDALNNSTMYHNFFKWKNHYQFKASEANSEICNICTALNDEEKMKTSVFTNFRSWWNTPTRQKTYEIVLRSFLFNKNLQDLAKKYNFSRSGSLVLWKHIRNQSAIPQERLDINYSAPHA